MHESMDTEDVKHITCAKHDGRSARKEHRTCTACSAYLLSLCRMRTARGDSIRVLELGTPALAYRDGGGSDIMMAIRQMFATVFEHTLFLSSFTAFVIAAFSG